MARASLIYICKPAPSMAAGRGEGKSLRNWGNGGRPSPFPPFCCIPILASIFNDRRNQPEGKTRNETKTKQADMLFLSVFFLLSRRACFSLCSLALDTFNTLVLSYSAENLTSTFVHRSNTHSVSRWSLPGKRTKPSACTTRHPALVSATASRFSASNPHDT